MLPDTDQEAYDRYKELLAIEFLASVALKAQEKIKQYTDKQDRTVPNWHNSVLLNLTNCQPQKVCTDKKPT